MSEPRPILCPPWPKTLIDHSIREVMDANRSTRDGLTRKIEDRKREIVIITKEIETLTEWRRQLGP